MDSINANSSRAIKDRISKYKGNIRSIGTPYIHKRKPIIKVINPADNHLSYSVIMRSPLDLRINEMN